MTIIVISKTKEKFFQASEREFIKRLSAFAKLDILILPAKKNGSQSEIIESEGKTILAKIKKDDFVIALDKSGKQFTSEEFAKKFESLQNQAQNIVFVIGGTYGLNSNILDRANLVLSFSQMTFTHEMIRTILLEQIYRAHTILNNKPYHY